MRSSFLPQLPTLDESGLKGFDMTTWWGVSVAAKTPQPVVDRLSAEILKGDGLARHEGAAAQYGL